MRPGQLTPENKPLPQSKPSRRTSFNEAGAINPGKHRHGDVADQGPHRASMRPGQLTPENVAVAAAFAMLVHRTCFNEAGAINPGKQCKRLRQLRQAACAAPASMRPGQLTPENMRPRRYRHQLLRSALRFNEAGAINPGKQCEVANDLNRRVVLQ